MIDRESYDMTPNYEERIARLDRVMKQLEDTQIVMAAIQERQAEVQRLQAEESVAHAERIKHIETNLAEATDKLNALINLMDRHQKEHRERPQ